MKKEREMSINEERLPKPTTQILINGIFLKNFFNACDILPDNFSEHFKFSNRIIVALQSADEFYRSIRCKTNRNMKNSIRREHKNKVKSSGITN